MILSVIWQAVEDPVEGMSKLKALCSKKDEYQRNQKKLRAWYNRSETIWKTGVIRTLLVGGIWSFLIRSWNPLIWFAVVTIVLGILCFVKKNGLKSAIKAYESKYGKSY